MENLTLKEKAEKLELKNSWIRKGLIDFFDNWEEQTEKIKSDNISSKTVLTIDDNNSYHDFKMYLYTGYNTPCVKCQTGERVYLDLEDVSILKIKEIIKNLPEALKEIENLIEKRNLKADRELDFLKKLNIKQ